MVFRNKHGFWRGKGSIQLTLAPGEAAVVGRLVSALAELVEPVQRESSDPLADMIGIDSEARLPEDPAVLRLFPQAYRDDDEAAAEFRRFTERGLRQLKSQRLAAMQDVLDDMAAADPEADDVRRPVSPQEAEVFLGGLNDLRLVLGSRLGIVDDDQDVASDWSADDPRTHQYDIYQWLSWLQATLLEAMHP